MQISSPPQSAARSFVLLAGLATSFALASSGLASAAPQGAAGTPTAAATPAWPQMVKDGNDAIIVYQPQFERLNGDVLTMSAAVTVESQGADGKTSSRDGIATLSAQAVAADVPGELEINGITCASAAFDGSTDTDFASRLSGLLTGVAFTIDRATLVEDMQIVDARSTGTPGLSFQPPRFVDSNVAAVLVSIDGQPILVPAGTNGWKSVKNTAFVVLQSPEGRWFVEIGAGAPGSTAVWMSSDTLTGTYASCDAPPADAVAALGTAKAAPDALSGAAPAISTPPAGVPKRVVVATEPTVLIAIDGTPKMMDAAPGVLAVTNANCVLLHVASPNEWWTLQAGRWFHAAPSSPWKYAPPEQVPAVFAQLPSSGRLAAARASVPGTAEAKAAVVAASEVRTVTVKMDATCSVTYAGEPAFRPAGSSGAAASVGYATNASEPVLGVGTAFYCCQSGVWFTSSAASGPWTVTDDVPAAIYAIPPSCPDYPVTYVSVYGSTKDPSSGALTSVTFGYTSGYLGTYLNGGTPVYGTGYNYGSSDAGSGASTTTADNYQAEPQTYGANALYDNQSGTYAPNGYSSDYNYLYPSVQPYYLDNGWDGWGWCPYWSSGWGWGYNSWYGYHNWSWWSNHWNPYQNPNWRNDWQQNHQNYANNRANNALAGSSASNPWGESSDWQKWNAANAAGDEPQNKTPADWQKWNAANAAGDEPQNKTPADWQRWNAANAAGDEPQDKTPANWQKWNAANAAGDEPQDKTPADWQKWNTGSGESPNLTRNQPYNWNNGSRSNASRGTGWNTQSSRDFNNSSVNRNYGAAPRAGYSGFHPSYNYGYRPSWGGSRAPAAGGARGGGGRR
ncbi:MAG: hypothetical protein LW806_08080 [Planctomycetaceae bacterium]|nr:hypothetical protein [Planctomycetaceae bacterium]